MATVSVDPRWATAEKILLYCGVPTKTIHRKLTDWGRFYLDLIVSTIIYHAASHPVPGISVGLSHWDSLGVFIEPAYSVALLLASSAIGVRLIPRPNHVVVQYQLQSPTPGQIESWAQPGD